MCRQEFVKYYCGHTRLTSILCPSAHNDPLFAAIRCPAYEIDSNTTTDCCGGGRFYCNNAGEGSFLNFLHNVRVQADEIIPQVEELVYSLRMQCEELLWAPERAHLPCVIRGDDVIYRRAFDHYERHQKKLLELRNQRDEAFCALEHARYYFTYRQLFEMYCGTTNPTATPSAHLLTSSLDPNETQSQYLTPCRVQPAEVYTTPSQPTSIKQPNTYDGLDLNQQSLFTSSPISPSRMLSYPSTDSPLVATKSSTKQKQEALKEMNTSPELSTVCSLSDTDSTFTPKRKAKRAKAKAQKS